MEQLLSGMPGGTTEKKRDSLVTQYTASEASKQSVRILLVEDNPVNQRLATIMLERGGYKVEVADNGRDAVEKYTARPDTFDLIFMDIQMPDMDGHEATRLIRTRGFTSVPIIALTAHAMKGEQERCLATGMNDYITKPIKRGGCFREDPGMGLQNRPARIIMCSQERKPSILLPQQEHVSPPL